MTKGYIKDYPRPQFVRPAWESLNGTWDFAFDDKNAGLSEKWYDRFPSGQSITVPFNYETQASGIGDESAHPVVWYHRSLRPSMDGKRVLLHFEGSDYLTQVWVNGRSAGQHAGGYTRFSFDITDLLGEGESSLVVRVEDSFDTAQVRGKQRWGDKNYGCWYVQTTGIWKTVWLEYVPAVHLHSVKLTPRLADGMLDIEWQVASNGYTGEIALSALISFQDQPISSVTVPATEKRGKVSVKVASESVMPWGLRAWSPRSPDLYDIRFELSVYGAPLDRVDSYFGMREIRIEDGQILLNGHPLYQRLLLDQGYWLDSHLTPPSEESLIEDIDKTLQMGYNGVRKHQKTEDERFFYWCDVKGLLTWCEGPSPYTYGDDMAAGFTREWLDIVEQYYNHPSVITWTILNESWGIPQVKTDRLQQHFTEALYHLTKAVDPMRPAICNDGWEHTVSDIITLHDYEEDAEAFASRYLDREKILDNTVYYNKSRSAIARGYRYAGQPVIISEYGGIAYRKDAKDGAWGYGKSVETEQDLLRRMEAVTTAIKKLPYVCGYCYTQLSDVQQEVNGLLHENRDFKVSCDAIREINLK